MSRRTTRISRAAVLRVREIQSGCDLLRRLNERHLAEHNHDPQLEARIRGFELAYRMQTDATDEFGFKAVEKPVHVHDLHATILHLLGIDHEELTYHYSGRDFRLTDVQGKVVRDIIA